MKSLAPLALSAFALAFSAPAIAADVLDFEGVGDLQPVDDFYAPNYYFFSGDYALVDSDAGGSGFNIENEPSPNTVLLFSNPYNQDGFIYIPNGFTDVFSLFYSSASGVGLVRIYDGLQPNSNVIATFNVVEQSDYNCDSAPYCNWTLAGATFAGTAYSIRFESDAFTVYDNLTFGSGTPGGAAPGVPEPATWAMLLLGFAGAGAALRSGKRRRSPRAPAVPTRRLASIPAGAGFDMALRGMISGYRRI
jgi:hypothetical protein